MGCPEAIRVYLRLRPQISVQHSSILGTSSRENAPCSYILEPSFSGRTKLMFHVDRRNEADIVNNSLEDFSFQFRHVFEPQSTQEDVFNVVAKDCVLSVLDGYNSTIFAYGQTGSGKTYSITGGTESYDERGIIPRALGLIYDGVAKRQQECFWNVSVSYLQIYNDKGQDLLNHGKDAKTLEDLPNVTLHETTTGPEDDLVVVLRGLQQHAAPTLTDALNLLFLGDTNRLYCETPMNRTSSRSHCVFTISLEAHVAGTSVVRRSKLNLVDLAGSERVSKSGVGGTILSEAKYINLSLHYLEHVIVALSEQAKGKRDHVPFRNSFLTMVLRDSLGGNCRTSMLATAHLSKAALPETISTCSFAQRVALIKQDARINEETDPVLLVKKLKAEVAQLKDQLAFYEKNSDGKGGTDRELSEEEKILCRNMVEAYIGGGSRIEGFEGEMLRIYYCFDLMKRKILGTSGGVSSGLEEGPSSPLGSEANGSPYFRQSGNRESRGAESVGASGTSAKAYEEQIERLQISLKQKENEINTMLDILHRTQGTRFNAATQTFSDVDRHHDANALINDARRRSAEEGDYSCNDIRPNREDPPQQSASSAKGADLSPAFGRLSDLAQQGKINSTDAAAAEEYLRRKQQQPQDISALSDAQLVEDRAAAFETFKGSYQNYVKIEATKQDLKAAYVVCKETAQQLNQSVDTMKSLKQQIQRLRAERAVDGVELVDPEEQNLMDQLSSTRERYNTLVAELRQQRETIDGMHAFMKHSQEQVARDFEQWFKTRKKQVVMAVESSRVGPSPKGVPNPTNNAAGGTFSNHLGSISSSAQVRHPSSAPTSVLNGITQANSTSLDSIAVLDQPKSSTLNNSARLFPQSALGAVSNPAVAPTACSSPGLPSSSSVSGLPLSMWMMPATSNAMSQQIGSSTAASHGALLPNSSASPSSLEILRTSPKSCNTDGNSSSRTTAPTFLSNANPKPFHLQPLDPQVASSSQPSGACPPPLVNKEEAPCASFSFVTPLIGGGNSHIMPTNTDSLGSSYVGCSTQSNPYAPAHRSTGNKAADEQLAALYKLRDAMRQNMGGS
ncbi:unnamed protein product [Phytomonas sp. EM1]|nr:unnamed protein product [Phytomonas sp. EM1]|eukprot:CCW61333.1 unnamed protein product [Phytomonas sp. isolate EM1]